MKTIVLFLLLAGYQCAFGQTDTNVVAIGNWSEPVTDEDGYTLRGRLLIYDAEYISRSKMWGHARIYLELQQPLTLVWYSPAEVYFDVAHSLHFEMRDGLNKRIIPESPPLGSFTPNPCWVTVPCDSILRLRADPGWGTASKPNGLSILVQPHDLWNIRPGSANDYFLSATFSPKTNHPSALGYHVWQGTLELPRVKLPVKKP